MLWTVLYLQRNILFTYLVQLTCPPRATSSSSCRRRKSPWRKRYVVVYSLCLIIRVQARDNVVPFWSNGFFFRLSPRSQPGRLREGGSSSVNCDWLEWKFWLIIVYLSCLQVLCHFDHCPNCTYNSPVLRIVWVFIFVLMLMSMVVLICNFAGRWRLSRWYASFELNGMRDLQRAQYIRRHMYPRASHAYFSF